MPKPQAGKGSHRLQAVPNQRIQTLNAQLEEMARQDGAYFLDLYPLFANPEGYLQPRTQHGWAAFESSKATRLGALPFRFTAAKC